MFRLLSVWSGRTEDGCLCSIYHKSSPEGKEVTIVAVFRTCFPVEVPYDPRELVVFSLIGAICGFGGAMYCLAHRLVDMK